MNIGINLDFFGALLMGDIVSDLRLDFGDEKLDSEVKSLCLNKTSNFQYLTPISKV
jgi:hypothetical protein